MLSNRVLKPWAWILHLVLLLTLVGSVAAKPIPDPQTQRVARPFPPTQYIPDHDFDIRHIALDLRFDWEKEQLIGRETIIFAPLIANLGAITLDAANITPTSIKLSSGSSLQFQIEPAREKVGISLDQAYKPTDVLTMVIEYHTNGPQKKGVPGLVGVGLKFLKPGPDDPLRPKQIWSQGESEYNHYWFLCYDHPNDFFTSELSATVEKPLRVISNGGLVDTKENGDGTKTYHWKIDQPHASYLTSIIVGDFSEITSDYLGVPITTYVYPNELNEGRITAARLPEMVKFFSEKTGLKYPYAKYAQTTAHDFGGGMENISATTQTDNMIHDARTELDSTSDGLQSHELAHQWFGDYLTARSWSDIWLNESFATYFQAMWDEYKLGSDDFLYTDIKANQDSYFIAWKQGNRRPIVTKNYSAPDSVFDTYAYPRGGAVLHMLRKDLGEENWWRAINYYLKKYSNQPVETEQLRIAIEESTGQSMDWFFDEWLYRMGHPVFEVTKSYDPATHMLQLVVRQQQTQDPDSQYPQVGLFQTPVEIEIGTASKTSIERVRIEPRKEQTFSFKLDSEPLLVNFDYKGTLIKELEFKKTTAELAYQLEKDQDVLGRVWALGQLSSQWKNQASSEAKDAIANELAKAVATDKFWGVRLEAATALADVTGPAGRNALIAATRDSNARVRARAVTSLGRTNDATLASLYKDLLNDQSYGVIKASALALGQTKSPTAFDALATLLKTSSWRDNIRVSALAGLGALGDKKAMDLAARYVEQGNLPAVRVAAVKVIGTVGKGDPNAFAVVARTLEEAVRTQSSQLVSASGEALVSVGDPRGLVVFERLTKDVSNAQYLAVLAQFQERLRKGVSGMDKGQTAN